MEHDDFDIDEGAFERADVDHGSVSSDHGREMVRLGVQPLTPFVAVFGPRNWEENQRQSPYGGAASTSEPKEDDVSEPEEEEALDLTVRRQGGQHQIQPVARESDSSDGGDLESYRDLLRNAIRNYAYDRIVSPLLYGTHTCDFEQYGCRKVFSSRPAVSAHLIQCINGVFRYCKESECNAASGRMIPNLMSSVLHATNHHVLHQTAPGPIGFNLSEDEMHPPVNGYHLKKLACLRFTEHEKTFDCLLALIIQNLGMTDQRVMFATMLYSEHEINYHLVEVELTLKGQDGGIINPVAYPGFLPGHPVATTRSYAFKNIQSLITAIDYLDGVVTYSLNDILKNTANNEDGTRSLVLDVQMKGLPCLVMPNKTFPQLPYARSWDDLDLLPEVRRTMTDGGEDLPTMETRITLPQLGGQSDVIVESAYPDAIVNVFMAGIFNFIRQQEPTDYHQPRPVRAIVVYPTISMVKTYREEWKRRGEALNVDVFTFDSYFDSVVEHLRVHGTDILLITSTFLHKLLHARTTSIPFKELLTANVKFLYFHHLHKFLFPEIKKDLEEDSVLVYSGNPTEIIRIAFLEYVGPNVRNQITNSVQGSPLFPNKWNELHVGIDPERVIAKLNIRWKTFTDTASKVQEVMDTLQEYPNLRWLILGIKIEGNNEYEELIRVLKHTTDPRDITIVTKESDVFVNNNFWKPFKSRQASLMVGPWFLIDYAQSSCCEGIMIYSSPVHRADFVRIDRIITGTNGENKPCIAFRPKAIATAAGTSRPKSKKKY